MMPPFPHAALAFALAMTGAAAPPPEQDTTVSLVFASQASPVWYELARTEDETNTLEGQPSTGSRHAVTTRVAFTAAVSEDSDNVEITEAVDSIRIELEAASSKLGYDSQNPEHSKLKEIPIIDALIRASSYKARALLARTGDAIEIRNLDEIQSVASEIEDEQIKKYVKGMLQRELILYGLRSRYYLLPDHPVKVGESWSHEFTMPQGETFVQRKLDMTLTGVSDEARGRIATVRITGKELFGFGERMMNMPNVPDKQLFFRMLTLEGELRFSLDEGIIDSLRILVSGSSYIYPPVDPKTLEPGTDRPKLTTDTRSELTFTRSAP